MKTAAIISFFAFLVISSLSPAAYAGKVYIDLAAPTARKLPVAVQELKDIGPAPAPRDKAARERLKAELTDALLTDLRFSGFFSIIDSKAHIDGPDDSRINFRNWRAIGADGLITGSFSAEGDKLTVEVRYYDCVNEKEIAGKKLTGSLSNPRRIVHFFSDGFYEELTGKPGVFTTRLLFVSDNGGNKEIYISDYDGRNAMKLTRNRSINLAPQWSPDGKKALYVSYKRGAPGLYSLELSTGKDDPVSVKSGINIGGRFSPDGKSIALTLSGDKSPELHLLDLNSGEYRKLTDNNGIDVSPSWSPDGKRLVYVSDLAGNPHIFMLDLLTGKAKRITFNGKYNSSPAWSPDGKSIAFARSDSGKFNIWVMQPDGSGLRQLTFDGDNRNPSWSPDGRYIIHSVTVRGSSYLSVIRSDGTSVMKIRTGIGNERAPAWSPFLK